jgi:putative transposase
MARPLRIELSGGLYHVTSRGNRREDIYFSEDDRRAWLEVFVQVCERFNWVCHAYCQMTNHYHIVVETPEGNLSQGMRQLNGIYTQRVNRTHGRVGHVFQGRFKGILVEKDAYLLELSRYVVLNPVRAGMVADCRDWPWSSYRAMLGEETVPLWLESDWILGQFAAEREQAVRRYVDFVRKRLFAQAHCVWHFLVILMLIENRP